MDRLLLPRLDLIAQSNQKKQKFGFDGRRREEMRGEITRDEETRDEREDTRGKRARGHNNIF